MTTSPLRLVTGHDDGELPPLERYEIHMRAAGLSARWIDDSLALLHQIERFADASIEHVPALTIQRFLGRDGLAQSTRYTYFGYSIAFFRWYEQHGGHNPMLGMRRPRMPRSEPRPVTDDQLQRLLAQRMHKRTRVMILLAALAGLRVHEIAKVRGEDVDLIGRTLHVTGKGGHSASIPLHPLLIEAGYQLPRNGWWFPANSTREGHIHGRSVGSVIGLAMRRADIPSTAHALRHYFGTTLVSTGADLRTTQTLMRHASLQSTEIYTAVSDERRIDAISRLGQANGSVRRKGEKATPGANQFGGAQGDYFNTKPGPTDHRHRTHPHASATLWRPSSMPRVIHVCRSIILPAPGNWSTPTKFPTEHTLASYVLARVAGVW